MIKKLYILILIPLLFTACESTRSSSSSTSNSELVTIPLSIYQKVYKTTQDIYIQGDYVYITTDGVPDHNSPYFINNSYDDSRYETNDDITFDQNPNNILAQTYTFKLPHTPQSASVKQATSLGAMGVALNGVPFFNQYAGPNNQPLTNEIFSFDQYNGHPAPGGSYHYHIEPLSITASSRSILVGFLLDGYPVYGPIENGIELTSDDLDEYHGHEHITPDFDEAIYHYHITADDPYINGSGFYGTPGQVTQ
ncbi:YHYH protein [Candidatus Marinamargulisbacteria bacterium SCGC AG-414-C22]|nr:YHYH protein [Candidatus Marinamargulisbacteria bacterium SCGC AG-414-C22]